VSTLTHYHVVDVCHHQKYCYWHTKVAYFHCVELDPLMIQTESKWMKCFWILMILEIRSNVMYCKGLNLKQSCCWCSMTCAHRHLCCTFGICHIFIFVIFLIYINKLQK
jgi:hypothetical protein